MSATAGQELCPLCVEPLDATERAVELCPCGFSLCRFCLKKLMETDSGRCPNCRMPYDESKLMSLSSVKTDDLLDDAGKKKKKKGERKRGIKLTGQERRNLQELRILQKNLVYAVGLSLEICVEQVLAQREFFGQFGSIKKISVNRSSPYSSGQSRNGPTGAAYVTFVKDEDAADCVAAIDGSVWDGHYIRACFGTTKYCQAFLKGAQCNNPDCLYMHYLVTEGTFTKEEMNSGFAKGKPEFYHLINFDRSKGPVPGSLAKPPKGPGPGRKDIHIRAMGESSDSKGRPGGDADWPQLSQKGRSSMDASKERFSLDIDRSPLLSKKSIEGTWTSTLKSTASGPALIPSPFTGSTSTQTQKKVAVLSSPVKVKMVTTRSTKGPLPSPVEPPFGQVTEERLMPKLSTDSNLSHVSLTSDVQSLESNVSGLYVPPHAAAENRLRATKSATPLEEDSARDNASIEAMIRRRISVPERMIDEAASALLNSTGGRRGPPPGFSKLMGRPSAQESADRSVASDRALQMRLSYEAAAAEALKHPAGGSLLDQLAQNMIRPQTTAELAANLVVRLKKQHMIIQMRALQGAQLPVYGEGMESPFGGGGQPAVGQSNMGYPLDMQSDLLQSLISASSGLSLYPLQGKSSTQLSGRGSVPTMQTRLSADAIDRTNIFDLESLQKGRLTDGSQAHALNVLLNIQDSRGMQRNKMDAEALVRQNVGMGRDAGIPLTPSPFNDPAVLAFKKPGQQEMYHMGSTSIRTSDPLAPLREQQNPMPMTPFDDPGVGMGGVWGGGMPVTPFMAQPEMHQWTNASSGIGSGTGGLYTHSGGEQVLDAAGFFYPDKVSSTRT